MLTYNVLMYHNMQLLLTAANNPTFKIEFGFGFITHVSYSYSSKGKFTGQSSIY